MEKRRVRSDTMPNPPDFSKLEKVICDGTFLGVNKQFVTLAMYTGDKVSTFAMVPEDAKNLATVLIKTIETYEEKFGTIYVNTGPVPSPIQL